MTPLIFALCSLGCAAVNDIIFKCHQRKKRPVGGYMLVIGCTWAAVFLALFYEKAFSIGEPVTLLWGIVSGLFSVVANILLIRGLAISDVSLASVIYRLNLAPAAIFAFIFFGESVSSAKIAGVAFAIFAVFLFSQQPKGENKSPVKSHSTAGLWMLVAASLLRAAMGLSYKYGLECDANMEGILILNGMMWAIGGILYYLFSGESGPVISRKTISYGVGSGVLITGITLFMMLALKDGDASVVLPVTQLSFLGTALLGALFLKEKFTVRKTVGLGFGLLCILCMTGVL